jgi:DNA-binding XRE family transcriptional regulator
MKTIIAFFPCWRIFQPNANDHFHFVKQPMPPIRITDTASLGLVLRNTRKALGITQEALSLQTGISRPTIRAIEQGKDTAHFGLVLKLCQDLGIGVDLVPPQAEARS